MKIGLKLWSTNDNYLDEARRLHDEGIYQYIELYTYPGTYNDTINWWKGLLIPYIIHAPHFMHGMNLSDPDNELKNRELALEAFAFADALQADNVIFHPGCEGTIDETIRQIRVLGDSRMIIENKPYQSIDGKYRCVGYSVEEIRRVIEETGIRFCLDFGHAICTANALGIDPVNYIEKMNLLQPVMYHFSDGDYQGLTDRHDHFGEGTFPVPVIVKKIRLSSHVTLEVKKNDHSLNDFIIDVEYIKSIIKNVYHDRIYMRHASIHDCEQIYTLSNDPLIRNNSFNSDSIKWDEHIDWFEKILLDRNILFLVFYLDDMLVGQIRYILRNMRCSISISIVPWLNGFGFGSRMLECSFPEVKKVFRGVTEIQAYVKANNSASDFFFVKNRFIKTENTNIDGYKTYTLTVG